MDVGGIEELVTEDTNFLFRPNNTAKYIMNSMITLYTAACGAVIYGSILGGVAWGLELFNPDVEILAISTATKIAALAGATVGLALGAAEAQEHYLD